MKKRIGIALLLLVTLMALLVGCGKTKVLKCDNCGTDVTVKESSNMEDDWTVYCETCNEELFGDNPLLNE